MATKRQASLSGVEVRESSVRVLFTDAAGKRHRKTLTVNDTPLAPTSANITHAARLVDEIRTKIRLGVFSMAEYFPDADAPGTVGRTVGEQLDVWLKAVRIEASTAAGYSSAAKFWKASIGSVPLAQLKLSAIKTATAARPDLSGKTINNYVAVLRESIELARADGVVDVNPADDKGLRATYQKPPPDPFSKAEADAICAYAREHWPEPVANYIECWFYAGFRTSELNGLKWGSIDFRKRIVRVHEVNVRGVEKDTTKTNVERDIRLNSRALAAIKAQKAHTFLAGSHVFLDPRYGAPWDEERAFRRSFWTPALKALGIRYRRPYQCRHTYATMLLMAGAKPAYAAGQMGHSIETFLSKYARWIDDGHGDLEQAKLEVFLSLDCPREGQESA